MIGKLTRDNYKLGGGILYSKKPKEDAIDEIAKHLRGFRKQIETADGTRRLLLEKEYYNIKDKKLRDESNELIKKIFELKAKNKFEDYLDKKFFGLKLQDLILIGEKE